MTISRLIFLFALTAFQQNASAQSETSAVKTVIRQFFKGMETGDTTLLKSTCTEHPIFQSYMANKEGTMMVFTENFQDFVNFVGQAHQDKFKEKISFGEVLVEQSLASVWTPYVFYLNGKVSHCGTNSFQLLKTDDGWKIQYILDTRRKKGCK